MSWLSKNLAGISDEDIEWAETVADQYEGANMGKKDAARHLALGYVASQAYLSNPEENKNALFWIQAREMADFSPGDMSAKQDEHNNKVGFHLGVLAADKEQAMELINAQLEGLEPVDPNSEFKENRAVYYDPEVVQAQYDRYY